MLKKVILVLIIAFLSVEVSAQRPGGTGGAGMANMPAEGVIKGQIIDSYSNKPMEYANVVVFSHRDSSMVTGGVTLSDGTFNLTKVPFGRYYMVANFIGFNKLTLEDIRITPNNKIINLGEMKLDPSAESLEAIEVVAEREHIEFQIDKRVVNVSQDIMVQGGTAVDALENTPSVQVDIEGNVSLRGSGSFTVLIDGRPTVLQGSDALQQIPASNIEQIEIITNPSARYDPDGVAGIINVILKQRKLEGVNGIVNLSVGTKDKFSTDFLLNYRTGKFNIFGGANFRDYSSGGTRETNQETFRNDTTRYRISDGDREMTRGGYSLRAGADYYLSDQTTIALSGELGKFEFERSLTANQSDFTSPESSYSYLKTASTANRNRDYLRMTLTAQHKFDDSGQQIEALLYYSQQNGSSFNDQDEYITDADWNIIDPEPYRIRTTEPGEGNELRFKLDYVKPISESAKLEIGYQARLENDDEEYVFTNWDSFSNEWIENPVYSNSMDFQNDIHSLYGMYANTYKKFGYQIGLRGEYNYREITNIQSEEPAIVDRIDLFPSVHMSHTFDNKDQLQASYTRRIDRPRGWSLDPFIMYIDAFNRRQGNPFLKPEITDSYELAYQKRIWGSLFALEGYYRVTTDKITRLQSLQDDGTFLYTFDNINKDYSLGTELMINTTPVSWLELSLTGNLYHYRLEGTVTETDVDRESVNWNGRLNAIFRLPYDFRFQLNGRYNGPSVSAQGESKGFLMTSIALRKEFLNRQLSASVSVQDVFKTAKWENISTGPGFTSTNLMTHEPQVVMLTLSYRINNYKRQRTADNGGGEMEIGGGDDF
jgi:outer membrane receptor protein involved in Fe transport